jgi:CubicO group peptidase (beta-lactamase class C family)
MRSAKLVACRIATLVVASMVLVNVCAAQTNASDKEIVAKIDEYMKATTKSGLFMGSILVARDGKVLVSRGYGMADIEWNVPNTAQSKFDIASVSKTFVATLVLMLQERGKLSAQDPICKYLDDCPDAWREVTIHHLLTHTSGITNYTELPEQFEMRALASFLPNALTRIRKMPLNFKPGEKWSYSNTGYSLLHNIVERVSGKSYDAFLREAILDPLKMTNTGVFEKPGIRHLIVKNRAVGYTDGVGPLENAPWVYPSYHGGIGMYSTVEDMYLWGQSFYTQRLLSKKTIDTAFTPVKNNYGYGWFVFNKAKHKFVMHGGGIPGYGLTFSLYPDDKVTIFVASNLDTAPTDQIHNDLAAMVFGEKYKPPPTWTAVKVDPKIYDAYVGRYQSQNPKTPKWFITITKENDQLWNRLDDDPNAATMVLRPLSETRFFNKMFVLYEATFVKDDKGNVTSLIADGPWGHGEFKKVE